MSVVVVDAGVVVELALGGPGSQATTAALSGHRPQGPGHLLVEVLGVVRRLASSGVIGWADADLAKDRCLAFPVRLHDADADVLSSAWRYRHNLTVADAAYVALAARLGAPLLTFDHAFQAAPGMPCEVRLLA